MRPAGGWFLRGIFSVFLTQLDWAFYIPLLAFATPPWGARAKSAGLFFTDSAEQFVTATNRNCSGGVANRSGS